MLIVPVGFLLIALDLHLAFSEEYGASETSMFTLKNLSVLGPVYLVSFANFKLYFLFGILLLLTPIAFIKYRICRPVIIVLASYVLMYSLHYRSYYYLLYFKASAFDTARYMLNMIPLISLLFGISAIEGMRILNRKSLFSNYYLRIALIISMTIFFIFSACLSLNTRNEFTREEQSQRVQPVLKTIKFVTEKGEGGWIFTFKPCLYQIYGANDLRIVDLTTILSLDSQVINNILNTGSSYVALNPLDGSIENKERYRQQFEWIYNNTEKSTTEIEGMSIIQLKPL